MAHGKALEMVLNFEMAAPSSAAEERGGGFCDCSLLSH
jgi:hypothetical protein